MFRPRRYYRCYLCSKYSRDIVVAYIDGDYRTVCIRCFLAYALHETIRGMLRDGNEEDLKHVVRVLEGINDLVEDNPLTQAIRYVIDEWAQSYPKPLYVDELERGWRYRLDLDKVLDYLASEKLLIRSRFQGSSRESLSPGKLVRDLLRRFPTSKGFFKDIVKAVTGLAVVRYLADPKTRKFRAIYATLQAIASCIESSDREPAYEVKGYRCRLCGKVFSSKTEIRLHILKDHSYEIVCSDDSCIQNYIELIPGKQIGEWCRYAFFVEKASVYGVGRVNKYIRYLLTKEAIVPQEGGEVVVERNGEKYVAVDIAWIRVRERMRMLERQIVRTRW